MRRQTSGIHHRGASLIRLEGPIYWIRRAARSVICKSRAAAHSEEPASLVKLLINVGYVYDNRKYAVRLNQLTIADRSTNEK